MKIMISGASGVIGGEVLLQCLAHPKISSVIVFLRRNLPAEISNHPKIQCILIEDFSKWPQDVLREHSDAAGMIWNMGSYSGSVAVDLEYPAAFIDSMGQVLQSLPSRPPFRYVQLSGKFVRQDQDLQLWWGEKPRKIKGLADTKALDFAKTHALWKTFIVKPGGVITKHWQLLGSAVWIMAPILGENFCVHIEELGAFMTYLAIDGKGEEPISLNGRIVRRGKELLGSK